MRIGIIHMPGRHTYNRQSIQPKFFTLGFPLFPTGCTYRVSDNLGFDIPLTKKDFYHGFAKIHLGVLGLIGLVVANNVFSQGPTKIVITVLSLLLIGLCIHSWVSHSSAKPDESFRRRVFGKAFGYNMPPEYLPEKIQKTLHSELYKTCLGKLGIADWKKEVKDDNITEENFPILYTLSYYDNVLNPSPAHKELYELMESRLTILKNSRTKRKENKGIKSSGTSSVQVKFSPGKSNPVASEALKVSSVSHITPEQVKETSQPSYTQMTRKELIKVHDVKSTMITQMWLVLGFFVFALVIGSIFMAGSGALLWVILICIIIMGGIFTVVFVPDFLKLQKDIGDPYKMRVKVRVKDLQLDGKTAYLILRPNKYRIKHLRASSQYYNQGLLNKEIDIEVSKYSHTLIAMLDVKY